MNRILTRSYLCFQSWMRHMKSAGNRLAQEERGGAEIIAAIILLAIVIILAVAFKEKIGSLLESIWKNVDTGPLTSEIPF